MRIQLFIGEGWTPFQREANESVSWELPGAERLDVHASTEKLAGVFADRVRDVYPNADIEVLPQAVGNGRLVAVDLTGDAPGVADEALVLTAKDLEGGGFAPGAMIEGEIAGLLDGIIQERTHTWQVER